MKILWIFYSQPFHCISCCFLCQVVASLWYFPGNWNLNVLTCGYQVHLAEINYISIESLMMATPWIMEGQTKEKVFPARISRKILRELSQPQGRFAPKFKRNREKIFFCDFFEVIFNFLIIFLGGLHSFFWFGLKPCLGLAINKRIKY